MAKPYSQDEFSKVLTEIRSFVGARLQSVQCLENQLCLGFHVRNKTHHKSETGNFESDIVYLLFEMLRHAPRLYAFYESPLPQQRVPDLKPLGLFIKTHMQGSILQDVKVQEEEGRAFTLEFNHSQKASFLKVWLYPADANVVAVVEKKKVFLLKPSENISQIEFLSSKSLVKQPDEKFNEQQSGEGDSSTSPQISFLLEEGEKKQNLSSLGGVHNKKDLMSQQLQQRDQKRKKRLEGLQKSLESLPSSEKLNQIATHLLSGLPVDMTDVLLSGFDLKNPKQLAQKLFEKSKMVRAKIEKLKLQIEVLLEEIQQANDQDLSIHLLEHPSNALHGPNFLEKKQKKSLSTKHQVSSYQTIPVDDSTEIRVGANAKQNMQLLRQAKAWHLWLHIKDQPSAHGIVSVDRKKTEKTNWEGLFHQCARLYVEFLKKKAKQSKKDPREFDDVTILGCEVRYVKALPGDNLGRVTFSNEKTIRFRAERLRS